MTLAADLPLDLSPQLPRRRSGAKLLFEALRGQGRRALWGALAGVAWTSAKLTMPLLIRRGIDLGVRKGDARALGEAVALMLIVGLLGASVAGLRRYFAISVGARVEADLRARLFVHALRLDLAFHAREPAGRLVSRCASDLQQVQQPFLTLPMTVSNVVMLVGACVALLRVDRTLTAVAMAPALIIFFVARRFTRELGPRAQRLQQSLGTLAGRVEEALSGIRAIKGLGLEEVEKGRVRAQTDETLEAALRLNETRARYLPLIESLPAIGLMAVLWLGGQRVAAGTLTVGQLVQFTYYLLMLVAPLRIAGMTIAQFQRALVSAELIDGLLASQPAVTHAVDEAREQTHDDAHEGVRAAVREGFANPRGAEIRFERVSFAYDGGKPVLEELSFCIAPGETVGLVGATGAGKTTLVSLLARFHDVGRGRVLLDGEDLREWPLSLLRRQIGMVFEDAWLFSGSVRDNIAFAHPEAAVADVEAVARAAGAHDFIRSLDGGYDAPVGERGLGLSGGQRQRVALARALLTAPRVLVLDAATSAVDARKEEEIRRALGTVARGRTTLVIANRPGTLRLVDRVLWLEGGRLVATGTHDELLARHPAYRRLLAVEAP